MNDVMPVFILGNNRCGTTFVGNLLTQNFDISTIEHPLHFGILESNIYSYKKYFGDFSNLDNYIKSVGLFAQSDFQILAGLPEDFFLKRRAASFYHLFLDLMDEHAKANFKSSWTTKIDPNLFIDQKELDTFLDLVEQRYPQAKFIMIERNYFDYINSLMNMKGKAKKHIQGNSLRRHAFIAHRAAIYFYNNRKMEVLLKQKLGLKILFEEIIKNKEEGLETIKNYLGLSPTSSNKEVAVFKRNTSFHSEKKKKKAFAGTAKFWKTMFQVLPGLDQFLVKWANRKYLKPPIPSPLWWRMKKATYFKTAFEKELVEMNQAQLLEVIKDQSITA